MLISFAATNHRSLRGRTSVSLIAEQQPTGADRAQLTVPHLDLTLVPALGIVGPNGAGKSNVLDALRYIAQAVRFSQSDWSPADPPPRHPFVSREGRLREPSRYEIAFAIDDAVYEYEFAVSDSAIDHELLFMTDRGRRSRAQLFERRTDPGGHVAIRSGRRLSGSRLAATGATRPNSLFLSSAAQNNHEQLTPVWEWLSTQCRVASPSDRVNRSAYTSRALLTATESYQRRLRDFLRSADLGIADVTVTEIELPEAQVEVIKRVLSATEPQRSASLIGEAEFRMPVTWFDHGGDVGALELEEESAGTQAWYEWAAPVIEALDDGGVLGADELDAHLNDQLAGQLVTAFQSPDTNRTAAQVLFTAQDPAVITNARLGRDQVWIAEKLPAGDTELSAATDFSSRRQWDTGQAFRSGRYGGQPVLDDGTFRRALAGDGRRDGD